MDYYSEAVKEKVRWQMGPPHYLSGGHADHVLVLQMITFHKSRKANRQKKRGGAFHPEQSPCRAPTKSSRCCWRALELTSPKSAASAASGGCSPHECAADNQVTHRDLWQPAIELGQSCRQILCAVLSLDLLVAAEAL